MTDWDVIIVGGRAAGASAALLLARAGHRVLVLERCRRGSDTLSTHALMRPAVLQLERWGLLDDVVLAGTPGQDRVVFHYGDDRVELDVSRRLYAPRRTVLDPILVAAAERGGAHVRFGVEVRGLLRDATGRVAGVQVRDERGALGEVRGRVTVGADGRRSRVAREVEAPVSRRGRAATAFAYGYWTGLSTSGYEWGFNLGTTAGLIPTNDGAVCVLAGARPERFASRPRRDLEQWLHGVLADTTSDIARRVARGRRVGPVRGYPGMPGHLRRPWGRGWALVGDAGYFRDPTTAHGITDALRDAELLASALDGVLRGSVESTEALARYERTRDDLSIPLFDLTDAIAGFDWDLDEVQRLHLAMSREMQREVDTLTTWSLIGATPTAA